MGQYEDTFYEIYDRIEEKGLKNEFYEQLEKMKQQEKHKYKSVKDLWEYAYKRIIGDNPSIV